MKSSARILVVSVTNQGFWSNLGCRWRNATIFSCQIILQGTVEEIITKETTSIPCLFLWESPYRLSKCLTGSKGVMECNRPTTTTWKIINIFQVKKETSFSFGSKRSTQRSSKFNVKFWQANKKLTKCYSLLSVCRRQPRCESLTTKVDNNCNFCYRLLQNTL